MTKGTERVANHLCDLLARLREQRAHVASLEGDETRLLGQAAADSEARAQARECRRDIQTAREVVRELEAEINSTLDKLDRPDVRGKLLAERAKHEAQITERPNGRER